MSGGEKAVQSACCCHRPVTWAGIHLVTLACFSGPREDSIRVRAAGLGSRLPGLLAQRGPLLSE